MRAVIYARYSSDLQSPASIEDQVRQCRERIEQENGTVVEIYADYAISGAHLRNRPRMQALLSAAKTGRFNYVVAEALDRISRDQEDVAAIYKRLLHSDVRLLTQAEGEISELHGGLKGTMNALFLKDLAQKTRRGQRGRVEAGKIPGGKSYGYRIVRKLLPDGSVTTGEREINPEEAGIVTRIFKEYAEGMAPRQIAIRLNREGILSPGGGRWNASTINGNRLRRNGILNNELYTGRITYNRQRFLKDPETGKRIARLNLNANGLPERSIVFASSMMSCGSRSTPDGDPGSVREQLNGLEFRKRELVNELQAQPIRVVELHPNLADLYRRKIIELKQILDDEATRPRAFDIIRSLIGHIEVHPTQTRGHCDVVVVGALAQFLAFAQQKATAGSSRTGGTSLMVAGRLDLQLRLLTTVAIA